MEWTLYKASAYNKLLFQCFSVPWAQWLSLCMRTVSAPLIILTFLFKTRACSLSFEFMECWNPKLCCYVCLLWWIWDLPKDLNIVLIIECIPVSVSASELECLSCICGFLNALLKNKCNYNIWIRITIFFTFCPLYSWLFSTGVKQQRYFLVQPTMCSKMWRKDLRNHFLNKLKLDTASSNHKETSEWIITVWRGNYNQCVNLSSTFWIMFLRNAFYD